MSVIFKRCNLSMCRRVDKETTWGHFELVLLECLESQSPYWHFRKPAPSAVAATCQVSDYKHKLAETYMWIEVCQIIL